MTRDEAVALVKGRLSNRKDADLDPLIVAEMKLAQIKLESALTLPWFLLSEMSETTTDIGDERVELPEDFLREPEEETALWRYDTDSSNDKWKELSKDAYDKLKVKHDETGAPLAYALVGNYFRLKPTPDKEYPIRMIYYKRDQSLDSGATENKWLKNTPDLLIAETGFVIASQYLKDQESALIFSEQLKEARTRYSSFWTAREQAGRSYTKGDEK